MLAFHKAGLFKVEQKEIPADAIDKVFDNFVNVFGPDHKLTVELSSEESLPEMIIRDNATQLAVAAQIAVKNPLNHAINAIVIKSDIVFQLKPAISDHNYLLTASITKADLKIKSIKCLYNQAEKNSTDVEASLSSFIDLMRKTLNDEYLAKGLKLPLPTFVNLETLSQGAVLTAKNGYYLIEAEPKKKHWASSQVFE